MNGAASFSGRLDAFLAWAQHAPLTWTLATVGAFVIASWIGRRVNGHPLANPVLVSVAITGLLLELTGTPYEEYYRGAQLISFLLGPATVALAIPLVENIALVKRALLPIAVSLACGSLAAIVSVVGVAHLLGVRESLLLSLAPKSVTAPISMAVADIIGGVPALAMVATVGTGVAGAIIATPLFNLMKVRDPAARGFAIGVAAHGIGTARAFQSSEVAGAFAGMAMALNGLLTAALLPALLALF
ncbi:LrgB family protein [Camelimonas abortus]|uniref:LrgB family protein n=1 Tax=Camelimonas abortus TaxID=1017184 RepID=A0ABV7LEF7_9HYPH